MYTRPSPYLPKNGRAQFAVQPLGQGPMARRLLRVSSNELVASGISMVQNK